MPYANNNGVKIYYEMEGQGPPLVLLHGLAQTLEEWREYGYVTALRDHYRLILIDAKGHGKSDKPHNTEAYTMERRVEEISSVLDGAGISKSHFFGYSYGGRVCLELAKLIPERVISVIVNAQHPRGRNPNDPNPNVQFFRSGPEAVIAFFEQAGPLPAQRKARLMTSDYKAYAAVAAYAAPNLESDLHGMTMHFLISVGARITQFREEELKNMFGGLPNSTFFDLPGLTHGEAFSRSDLVLPHVKEFLARVSET